MAPFVNVNISKIYFFCPVINFGFITATKLGTRRMPPSMFKSKIVARKNPMVAWNIKGEKTQTIRPPVIARAVKTTGSPTEVIVVWIAPFKSFLILYSSRILPSM